MSDSHLAKKLFFVESPLKMMTNTYVILKAAFIPKIFKFLP